MKRKRLYSKRNKVYRIYEGDNTYISKNYININTLNKEYNVLKLLYDNNVRVPKIISRNNNTIIMEDLGNLTVLEWILREEKVNSYNYHKIIIDLYNFFQEFYKVTKFVLGEQYILKDVNLRNFVIRNNVIYGLDFELCEEGSIVSDIGSLVAYIITYSPIGSDWRYTFVNDLIHIFLLNFKLNKVKLIYQIEEELLCISQRRNQKIEVDNILCRIAEEII